MTKVIQENPDVFHAGTIGHHINHLLGEILTLIDASLVDPTQRKSVKDIIKTRFYDNLFSLKRDQDVSYLSRDGYISDILVSGSRSIDQDIDIPKSE